MGFGSRLATDTSVVSQKFVEKLQTMAVAEGRTQNPPESPFFKGGISSVGFKPLFGKACPEHRRREGKGRFLAERRGNYVANFWDRTLGLRAVNVETDNKSKEMRKSREGDGYKCKLRAE